MTDQAHSEDPRQRFQDGTVDIGDADDAVADYGDASDGQAEVPDVSVPVEVCDEEPLEGPVQGDVRLESRCDLQRYQNVTSVSGELRLAVPNVRVFRFPFLVSVGALMTIDDSPELELLDLPALESTGHVTIASFVLAELNLPSLTHVSGRLSIYDSQLVSLNLPMLASVGETFHLGEGSLREFSAPRLEIVEEGASFYHNHLLTAVALPSLVSLGSLTISHNRNLVSLDLPNLVQAERDVHVWDNQSLTSFSMRQLERLGDLGLAVTSNPNLVAFQLPSLREASWLSFHENPRLPDCFILDLRERIPIRTHFFAEGFRAGCTCMTVQGDLVATCP